MHVDMQPKGQLMLIAKAFQVGGKNKITGFLVKFLQFNR